MAVHSDSWLESLYVAHGCSLARVGDPGELVVLPRAMRVLWYRVKSEGSQRLRPPQLTQSGLGELYLLPFVLVRPLAGWVASAH